MSTLKSTKSSPLASIFEELGLFVLREHDLLLVERRLELALIQHAVPVAVVPARKVVAFLEVAPVTVATQTPSHSAPSPKRKELTSRTPGNHEKMLRAGAILLSSDYLYQS